MIAESSQGWPQREAVTLFAMTTFTASSLLFVIEPLFAKMVLPRLGGSPAVWNTCVLFFQGVLLVAYLYAHLTVRWLGARRQALVHLFVLLLPLLVLPVDLRAGAPSPGESPTPWLLRTLSTNVGLPFFAVATIAPLAQRWFGTLPVRSAADPYFLYSASNLGSMLALLAFPFLLEPASGVRQQKFGWTLGYLVLLVLAAACTATVWLGGERGTPTVDVARAIPPAARERVRWVVWSLVPSSLMLGVTTYISTDLAAVPLLWIVPLSLYLATFILVFAQRPPGYRIIQRGLPLIVVAAVASIVLRMGSPYLVVLHLGAFFAAALTCHGLLARSRPPTAHLTEFYLWLSVGGVLGGVFNTLIAPHIFNGIYEYPLMLAIGCLVSFPSRRDGPLEPWGFFVMTLVVPAAACAVAWHLGIAPRGTTLPVVLAVTIIVVGGFWAFAHRRAPFNVVVVGLALLVVGGFGGLPGRVLFSDRSFFGVVKVVDSLQPGIHVLQHGTTLHGRQNVRSPSTCEPLSYYHHDGPVGQLFDEVGSRFREMAVIGLGTGALACYAGQDQRMHFFEIDPMVGRIAQDPALFTYLQNSGAETVVSIGDGRKMLEGAPTGSFDLIVVDAFSSDSVPVHLITREALRLYASRLRERGLIAFHISNRYLDLESVLGATTKAEGLSSIANRDVNVSTEAIEAGRSPSHWVVGARHGDDLDALRGRPGWQDLKVRDRISAWTDDYSNILDALITR
jgi:hypothetical protein